MQTSPPRSLPIQSHFQKTAVYPQPISTCHAAEDGSRHWGLDQFHSDTPTLEWSNLWPTVQSNRAVSQTGLWHLLKVVKLMKNPPPPTEIDPNTNAREGEKHFEQCNHWNKTKNKYIFTQCASVCRGIQSQRRITRFRRLQGCETWKTADTQERSDWKTATCFWISIQCP